jgi:hypothetical protein
VEQPTINKSKTGAVGPVLNKEHALFFFSFNVKGIVHCEFVLPNTMVNSDFYCDVLRCLRENVRRKRPERWCNYKWPLHHHNAPTHMCLKTIEFVTKQHGYHFPSSLLSGLSPL